MSFSSLMLPAAAVLFCVCALLRGRDVFEDFSQGVQQGLQTLFRAAPATYALCFSLAALQSSGALDLLCSALSPLLQLLGIPAQTAPLVLMRPVSGSGANALFQSILAETGPDSYAGTVASVMMGATDTTLYTLTLYFSQTSRRKPRSALPAALLGDLAGFAAAAAAVRLFMGP